MDSETVRLIWGELLPAAVVIKVGAYVEQALPGGVFETRAAEGMHASRRIEFLSGRFYARQALQALGHVPCDIPIAADRGPEWPAGIVGSITHTSGTAGSWAAVAAARMGEVPSLGIDVEQCAHLDAQVLDVVLTAGERERMKSTPAAMWSREAGLIWCAKEAALKAARGVTEPNEVEIELAASGQHFQATWLPTSAALQDKAWRFHGRAAYRDGYAFAAAY